MLEIRKLGYSSRPWRILHNGEQMWCSHGPMFAFDRKRDAVPFLNRLLEIGDWSQASEFTVEQKRQVMALVRETDSYKQFVELVNRGNSVWVQ